MNETARNEKKTYCYNTDFTQRQTWNETIIEIMNYSCEKIDYAISNNLKLVSVETPGVVIWSTDCYKVYSRDFVNTTEVSRTNMIDYRYYTISELGNYYMSNCLEGDEK